MPLMLLGGRFACDIFGVSQCGGVTCSDVPTPRKEKEDHDTKCILREVLIPSTNSKSFKLGIISFFIIIMFIV